MKLQAYCMKYTIRKNCFVLFSAAAAGVNLTFA